MRIGIPLMKGRVAPRCTIAEGLLITTLHEGDITSHGIVPPEGSNWFDFQAQIARSRIDTLVCGGISRSEKDSLLARGVTVVDNVACTAEEALAAIRANRLQAGYGFGTEATAAPVPPDPVEERDTDAPGYRIDCLECLEPVCLLGRTCRASRPEARPPDALTGELLEAAGDITFERERKLCRLSELIYFALEMNYRRLGLAYCIDLAEPTRILVQVLRRFFDVVPVCCKIGGMDAPEPRLVAPGDDAAVSPPIACNPLGQARALNAAGTDLNVAVGLCVGVDCVFVQNSEAPVTTLFVKDKSLANNPIGALYSDYYLKEAVRAAVPGY